MSGPSPSPPRAITVFGGSRVLPETEEYVAAHQLGRALARHDFTVITGGYGGTMEAVSRGAKEAGGQTLGVTVDLLARRASPNNWVDQEIRTAALLQRVDRLIEMGAGYVILPGGAGTMLELGAVWNLAVLGALHEKPIVVLGEGWRHVFAALTEHLHAVQADLRPITFLDDPEAAARLLAERLGTAPRG